MHARPDREEVILFCRCIFGNGDRHLIESRTAQIGDRHRLAKPRRGFAQRASGRSAARPRNAHRLVADARIARMQFGLLPGPAIVSDSKKGKLTYIATSGRDTGRSKVCAGPIWGGIWANAAAPWPHDYRRPSTSKTISELSFLTAVHAAKGIAKREGISEVFACK
jgi:hypothetical protein